MLGKLRSDLPECGAGFTTKRPPYRHHAVAKGSAVNNRRLILTLQRIDIFGLLKAAALCAGAAWPRVAQAQAIVGLPTVNKAIVARAFDAWSKDNGGPYWLYTDDASAFNERGRRVPPVPAP
jgi:hypothetical protein